MDRPGGGERIVDLGLDAVPVSSTGVSTAGVGSTTGAESAIASTAAAGGSGSATGSGSGRGGSGSIATGSGVPWSTIAIAAPLQHHDDLVDEQLGDQAAWIT